jgi:hypothetical protein
VGDAGRPANPRRARGERPAGRLGASRGDLVRRGKPAGALKTKQWETIEAEA